MASNLRLTKPITCGGLSNKHKFLIHKYKDYVAMLAAAFVMISCSLYYTHVLVHLAHCMDSADNVHTCMSTGIFSLLAWADSGLWHKQGVVMCTS